MEQMDLTSERRSYTAPVLRSYGSIVATTKGSVGGAVDSATMQPAVPPP